MAKYKVRFNLSKGENYMKWKIDYPNGVVKYFCPKEVTLEMYGCFLRNQKATAQKIYKGANKTVCAWIEADYLMVRKTQYPLFSRSIKYNPRVKPNWDIDGENADNTTVHLILTHNNKLYTK